MDHHATTPLDPQVLQAMLPYFSVEFGNASSTDHIYGLRAKAAVDHARENVAEILGCRKASEIVFTSGATEANNLALKGFFEQYQGRGKHILVSQIEHPCVLKSAQELSRRGAEIEYIPVDNRGRVSAANLRSLIRPDTILVSIMYANNEVGTIEPIGELAQISRDHGAIFHCDAAQAVGHEPINVYDLNVDLLSLSAHKFYGPKGVGCLFVRSYEPNLKLSPIISGGGHERGRRSGTLNVPGIVGLSRALELCARNYEELKDRVGRCRDMVQRRLLNDFPDIRVNGNQDCRLAHNLNVTIPGVEAKALVHELRETIAFSTGAACSTAKIHPSHVLRAMGLTEQDIYSTIRLGFGRSTLAEQIAEELSRGIRTIRQMASV